MAPKQPRGGTPSTATAAVKREPSSSGGGGMTGTSSTPKKETSSPAPASTATFRDFPVFSSSLPSNTRINLLRFAHHSHQDPTDPTQFVAPLKLNRKWPPRPKPTIPKPGDPVRDVGGNHVVGILPNQDPEGKQRKGKLYWPAYGEGGLEEIRKALRIPPELNISAYPPAPKEEGHDDDGTDDDSDASPSESKPGVSSQPSATAARKKTNRYGPRGQSSATGGRRKRKGAERRGIREIHKAPEDLRLLRKQELMPWVLEDFQTSEEWESGVQAAKRYKSLLAQFGEQYANCAGNAGIVQMYLRGAVESAQAQGIGTEGSHAGVGAVQEEKKKRGGFMDRNHAPWIGKLEGDVHGRIAAATPNAASRTTNGASTSSTNAGPSGVNVSSSPHVIFVFDHRHDGSFKLVPVQAAYKFTQKPAYSTTTADEANERWERLDKLRQRGGSAYQKIPIGSSISTEVDGQGEGARALLQARTRTSRSTTGPHAGTGAGRRDRGYVKKEVDDDDAAELASWSTFQQRNALALPGMAPARPRNLVAVYGDRRNGDGGGMGSGRIRGRGGGDGEGGVLDEVEYEEDFQDDEELHLGPGAENAQEESKQREYAERLKQEMSRAGWEGRISADEDAGAGGSDDDEDGADGDLFGDVRPGSRKDLRRRAQERKAMGRSGRELKKVMRMAGRAEGVDVYESEDDDANPYATEDDDDSDSDEERHLALTNPDEAVRRAREARREKEEREAAAARKRAAAAERDGTPALTDDGNRLGTGSRGSSPALAGPSSQQKSSAHAATATASTLGSQRVAAAGRPASTTSGTYIPRRAGSASPPPTAAPASPKSSQTVGSGTSGQGGPSLKVTLKRKSEAISGSHATSQAQNSTATTGASGSGSVVTSPNVSRAGSPAASGDAKRQKTASGSGGRAGSPSGPTAPKTPANDIEREVIRLVRDHKVQTTQELVRHFTKQVKNPESKEQLSAAIRRVCMIERGQGTLKLKDGW